MMIQNRFIVMPDLLLDCGQYKGLTLLWHMCYIICGGVWGKVWDIKSSVDFEV